MCAEAACYIGAGLTSASLVAGGSGKPLSSQLLGRPLCLDLSALQGAPCQLVGWRVHINMGVGLCSALKRGAAANNLLNLLHAAEDAWDTVLCLTDMPLIHRLTAWWGHAMTCEVFRLMLEAPGVKLNS